MNVSGEQHGSTYMYVDYKLAPIVQFYGSECRSRYRFSQTK